MATMRIGRMVAIFTSAYAHGRHRMVAVFTSAYSHGRHRMVAVFTSAYAISSKFVSLILASGEVY
jgi:hypothetical protein